MTSLQERFQTLRARRPEISNADLARLTGAKPPSVGDWFNGATKTLKADTAVRVAAVYSVNPVWLATGEGDMLTWDGTAVGGIQQVALAAGRASVTRPEPMSESTERRLTRLLAVLYQIPEGSREAALSAATEVLLDHLPPPPTE